jgi:diaminohydroxyphosphoribosylaminopyrimidine deaminase / 5-amino-6-(5-phosphoribosylamino)uracil reductase
LSAARDRWFMEQALALAALGEGSTSPNPMVGCLIVRKGTVVGRGYHRAAGRPHAEAEAVAQAGDETRGATVYVNLEPCSHQGRTPPCADLLVHSGVARVVAAVRDPNRLVDGKGFAALRRAGILVEEGLLEAEARELNAAFFSWHTRCRPNVTLKAAVSLDGRLSGRAGASQWITEAPARLVAHRLRLAHDAVLVGAATLRRDDPRLDARLAGAAAPRLRVVLAPRLGIDPAARLFEVDGPVRIYAAADLAEGAEEPFRGRATVVRIPASGGRLDIRAVLGDLASLGVQSLLVEGGGRTHAAFLDAGLADRAALFTAPILLGDEGATPLAALRAVDGPGSAWRLEGVQRFDLGRDQLVTGRLVHPAEV